ncbi:hypothetical protein HMPREF9946_02991 [Acetobacteraceae bacterium AT-5844]|nr:hypothetical protein HMPREF9946_02991 [Acetobacteraceae bacterium AT-5844]
MLSAPLAKARAARARPSARTLLIGAAGGSGQRGSKEPSARPPKLGGFRNQIPEIFSFIVLKRCF